MNAVAEWEKVKQFTEQIPGWLSEVENQFLFKMAQRTSRDGYIVEIGSYKGRSTICLALGSLNGLKSRILAIDPHTGSPDLLRPGETLWTYDEFLRNLSRAGVKDIVTPVVSTGEAAASVWRKPIDILFIDANYHSYEMTKNLLRLWIPHLKDGGWVLLNNVAPSFYGILRNKPLTGLPGPRRAALEELFFSRQFRNAGIRGCIGYAQKSKDAGLLDRVRGQLIAGVLTILYGIFWLYKCISRLPNPFKRLLKRVLLGSKLSQQ